MELIFIIKGAIFDLEVYAYAEGEAAGVGVVEGVLTHIRQADVVAHLGISRTHADGATERDAGVETVEVTLVVTAEGATLVVILDLTSDTYRHIWAGKRLNPHFIV